MDAPPNPPEPPESLDEVRRLLDRARSGDASSLPELRRLLDDHPATWSHAGDLAAHAERAWVELIAGADLVAAESLARKLTALKAELAGPESTPMERLLVERVAACWLQVHHADASAAQARDVSIRQAEVVSKRQDRAHRRYLTAIGALATLRKLLPASVAAQGAGHHPAEPTDGAGRDAPIGVFDDAGEPVKPGVETTLPRLTRPA